MTLYDRTAAVAALGVHATALASALIEAVAAFHECTGPYAQSLARADLDRWRDLAVGTPAPTCLTCGQPVHHVDGRWWHHPDRHGPTVHRALVADQPEESDG